MSLPFSAAGLREKFDLWQKSIDLSQHEEKILLLASLVVSAFVGLTIVAFVTLTERLGGLLVSAAPLQRLLTPIAGSLLGGWLLSRFFPSARGSGIPQTRVALMLQGGAISLPTVVGKFICSSIALGSGIALGREGPSVHIGAGVASVVARRLGLSEENVKALIPVGTAAAVAAAFNTPLAAVLFTLEEILADLHARLMGAVVIGAATSWIVLRLLLGDEPLFHVPAYQLVHPVEFLIYAILGLAGGVLATVFVKLLLWQRARFQAVPHRWRAFAPAAGGLTVGLLALAVPGVLGVGYHLVSEAINGEMGLRMMLLLLVLKVIATTTCYGSGNAGGIFGPSLFIGAMLGGTVGHVAHTFLPDHTGNAGAYALVGMGAAFAGIIRTPMTSVIMIFEVTRDYTIIVPLMIANLCSYLLAQRWQPIPIYGALSRQDGIVMASAAHLPAPLTVEAAMRPLPADHAAADGPSVHSDDTLDAALQRLSESGADEALVVSRIGARPIGCLAARDAFDAYRALGRARPVTQMGDTNWLLVLGFLTLSVVLVVSGLAFWQRGRRHERAQEFERSGQMLLVQGRIDEAVLAFRNALAQNPQDNDVRAALGLALIELGHPAEASTYLTQVAKAQPMNGPVLAGLARINRAGGNTEAALRDYRRSLAREWPEASRAKQLDTQLELAALMAQVGRPIEAFSLLLAVMERHGDDPVAGKKVIEAVAAWATPDQMEQAATVLTRHFPADSNAWMRLGDIRFEAGKDRSALEAYRSAAAAAPQGVGPRIAIAKAEEVLSLDPTRRGLTVRERARRWDAVLQRVLSAVSACGKSDAYSRAEALLSRRSLAVDTSDQKMEAAILLWLKADNGCKSDAAVDHILAKVRE